MAYYNFAINNDIDFLDKKSALANWMNKLYNITNQIFEYKNLPDTIPHDALETMLQRFGVLAFYEHEGSLYAFYGSTGGAPDPYYRPTQFFIANPALNFSAQPVIGEECVVIKNDTNANGLYYTLTRMAQLLVESEISFYNAIIAARDYSAFAVKDDDTRESAEEYQRQIVAGHQAIITSEGFEQNDIIALPRNTNTSNAMQELRETYQFIKSQLFTDIGLKSSHNMKRQYVSEEENIVDDDTLIPQIDDMLRCRKEALEEVNAMFGTNIEVDLRSTWKVQELEVENAIQITEEGPVDAEQTSDEATPATEGEPAPEPTEDPQEAKDTAEDTTEDTAEEAIEVTVNIEADTIEEVDVEVTGEETEDETAEPDEEETEPER